MNRRISPLPFVLFAPLALFGCPADQDSTVESESQNADDGDDDESEEDGSTGDVVDPPTTATTGPDDDGMEESSGGPDDDGIDTHSFLGDMGNGPEVECSVWSQDCPDGEKCMPYSNNGEPTWNATKCVAIATDPGQPGDPCTVEGSGTSGVDTCDEAAMCWNVDPENNMGTCLAFCSGSENNPLCDDPSTTCSITNDGVLILCLPNCDPLQQNCEGEQGCYGIPGGYVCAPDVSGPMGAAGEPCEAINVCDAGLECMAAEAVEGCTGAIGCCTEFCDHMDPDDDSCTGEHMCLPAFEMGDAPPGYESVGYCLIPV